MKFLLEVFGIVVVILLELMLLIVMLRSLTVIVMGGLRLDVTVHTVHPEPLPSCLGPCVSLWELSWKLSLSAQVSRSGPALLVSGP